MRPTHFFVEQVRNSQVEHHFEFHIQSGTQGGEGIAAIPIQLRKALPDLSSSREPSGFITYQVYRTPEKTSATARFYYPKKHLKVSNVRGIVYFLETLATSRLKKLGVTHLFYTSTASEKRRRQLNKVGLKINRKYAIDEWLAALGKGIKSALEWHDLASKE